MTGPATRAAQRDVLARKDRTRCGLLAGVVLAALLLTPLLGPSYVLVRDMSFVPDPPITPVVLGLQGVPRAVPSDLVVALLSHVVPAGWLQDLVLVAIVVGATTGAARLVPATTRAGVLAAATTYGWSVYLHERLLLGQWALLLGFAALPWGVRAALDWRATAPPGEEPAGAPGRLQRPRGTVRGAPWARTVAALGVAAVGGVSAGLVCALGVLPVLAGRGRAGLRRLTLGVVAVVVLALPWLLPALLAPVGAPRGDPAGVAAFAARPDVPGGLVPSLLTQGGIWASAAVPPGRSVGLLLGLVVLALALVGLPALYGRLRSPGLLVGAGLALLLASAGRVPGLSALLGAVVELPGAGVLRDGQKWLAPYAVLVSASVGCAVDGLVLRLGRHPARRVVAALLVLLPVAALPGAAWAESGRLQTSTYPPEWQQVGRVVAGVDAPGPVTVLPWSLLRAFRWTGDRTVLDPAIRLLPRRALVNDTLTLRGSSVRGEDPLAAEIDPVLRSGGPVLDALSAVGSPLVLVERRTRDADQSRLDRQVEGLELLWEQGGLQLWTVPGSGRAEPSAPLAPILLGQAAALALLLGASACALTGRRAGQRPES